MTAMGKFKATVLKDYGVIPASNNLEHRVLVVRDELNRIRVSAQVWWREDEGEWQPGKGYFLTGRQAIMLAKAVEESLNTEGEYESTVDIISSTQQYRICKSDSKNCVDISKWWRKSRDEDESWEYGKNVSIGLGEAVSFVSLLKQAGSSIINVR